MLAEPVANDSVGEPLVSVVMVVCNVERFLCESIESILGQTFRDFEFIIVDYGSTDSTKQLVAHFAAKDPRLRSYEIPHCGLGEARNAACGLARGQYLALMDADDVALPNRLQLEIDFMKENPRVGLLGGAVEWINAAGQTLVPIIAHPSDDRQLRHVLAAYCCFWQPTVLLRKQAFIRAGGYRQAFAPAEDYDLWLRIADEFECANLEVVVLKYRIHSQQVSLRKRRQQTLGILAARRSVALRRDGQTDVFDSIGVITPEVLTQSGVSESMQVRTFVRESRLWINHMRLAGEVSIALETAVELLRADRTHMEKSQISDLHLTVAALRWRRREFSASIREVFQAVRIRPKLAGRPLKLCLRRMRLVQAVKTEET